MRLGLPVLKQWHRELEHRTYPGRAQHRYVTAICTRDPAGDGQAKPVPARTVLLLVRSARRDAVEAIEQPREVLLWDARAIVGDAHPGDVAVLRRALGLPTPAVLCVTASAPEEVGTTSAAIPPAALMNRGKKAALGG